MSEIEGVGHGVKTDMVVVHVHRCEGTVMVLGRSSAIHLVAGCITSSTCKRAWREGESSAADAALSC